MATTSFHLPVTASQVGQYFLGQYYKVLQNQPDYLHHFYTASSTMLRTDGTIRNTATSLSQIHALVLSLNYTGVEIKTANSLESWNGGVLVMVSGLVRSKNYNGKRKFVETFFLAPQEKGYFVLNNIFHIIEDDSLDRQPVHYLGPNDQGYLPNASATVRKPASNNVMGRQTRAWNTVFSATTNENDSAEKYIFSEQQLQQIFEAKLILENNYTRSNGSFLNSAQTAPSQLSPPAEEFTGEHQKHTYASIVAKMQSQTPLPPGRQSVSSSSATENFGHDAMEGEVKSVYVRNLPITVTPMEIEKEFKKFGRIKPFEGVFIRTRKDGNVCYAFVEYEDVIGVQNAIKASKVKIAGREVFIEERRPEKIIAYQGRGKAKWEKRPSTEASTGHFGGRGLGRGNSFYREVSH